MALNKKTNVGDMIDDITDNLQSICSKKSIPDIITFVESKEWLGLPSHPTNPINLFPMQKITLKAFYRGSIGNENLELTKEELALCESLNLNNNDNGDLIEKYNNKEIFRDLVLVWGRRSGKDFCVSIIALYEAMKLLECPGGDPYAMYELSSANPINILTVANAKPQAGIAFREIRDKLLYSEYFRDKYVSDGISSNAIYLLTPKDKQENKEFKEQGLPLKKGSIGIVVGHSNSDSLLGMGCIVLILDEVASYKTTGGASSGDRIYTALTPTVQTYCRKIYEKDKEGNIVIDKESGQQKIINRIYDGKIISISSPLAPEGKFYEMFRDAEQEPSRLAIRLPTWDVNTLHTRESLRQQVNTMSETEFNQEFGAQFSGTGSENFFTEEQVKSCFTGHNLKNVTLGSPGNIYFVHIDPASSSHNYGLIVLHKEYYLNMETQKSQFVIVVDHIKHWSPIKGPINPEEVTSYIVGLKRRFRIGLLTYDAWASPESKMALRRAGIPNKETKFTSTYKVKIYRELEDLVNSGRIKIPYDHLLYNEMLELQRKFTAAGFRVMPKKDGDGVKSDDLCDCLSGASYTAIEQLTSKLPVGTLVEMSNPGAQNIVWRNMQGGIYGVGSGAEVSRRLEQRNSWPDYKRKY